MDTPLIFNIFNRLRPKTSETIQIARNSLVIFNNHHTALLPLSFARCWANHGDCTHTTQRTPEATEKKAQRQPACA
jgi:hypothetical protein